MKVDAKGGALLVLAKDEVSKLAFQRLIKPENWELVLVVDGGVVGAIGQMQVIYFDKVLVELGLKPGTGEFPTVEVLVEAEKKGALHESVAAFCDGYSGKTFKGFTVMSSMEELRIFLNNPSLRTANSPGKTDAVLV